MITEATEPLLTTKEAAALLGFKPQTLRTWVFYRKIPFVKIGSSVRFEPNAIREVIERGRTGGF